MKKINSSRNSKRSKSTLSLRGPRAIVEGDEAISNNKNAGRNLAPVLFFLGFLLLGIGALAKLNRLPVFSLNAPTSLISLISPAKDSVSPQQLSQMLKSHKFTLINVHTPYEGELPKTDIFIPFDQIMANSDSLPQDKNAPIILYCRSGRMSTEALTTLQKLGYTNVKQLAGGMEAWKKEGLGLLDLSKLESQVLPENGVELPVSWNDLGQQLVANGVIDLAKFKQAVKPTSEQEKVLTTNYKGKIKIDRTNSQFIVDMLWAIGLAQKSLVYDKGPMGTTEKKDAGNFASTGGWTLAKSNAMDYYNRFDLIKLTDAQQQKVAEISKNVYRPCCGNPTWFPDCNHGMAALAIIELLVANNIPDNVIYQKVLGFNSFWFPDQYLVAATYFSRQGTPWAKVDAKLVLGPNFSSGQGAQQLAQQIGPLPYQRSKNSSCGT